MKSGGEDEVEKHKKTLFFLFNKNLLKTAFQGKCHSLRIPLMGPFLAAERDKE